MKDLSNRRQWPPKQESPQPVAMPLPYDPFLRPADGVSIEEWRLLICATAGAFRLTQGFTRQFTLAPDAIALLASNTKSYALFVQVKVVPFGVAEFALSSRDSVPGVGSSLFTSLASQILLPKEQIYIRNTGLVARTYSVTEVTV